MITKNNAEKNITPGSKNNAEQISHQIGNDDELKTMQNKYHTR
jgi:hypothetical protein